jgi:light-regulated signal transduction histidine kinase (bacteriophytochrome)
MQLNARIVLRGANLPRLILLAIEDVTERRVTEWRLSEQRLELERSNAALNEFASVASHDLQEPLRKILSFGERLESSAGQSLAPDARQSLTRMLGAALRMRTLIDDLLAYSQVTTRTQPFAPTDLSGIAKDVLVDLETTVNEAGGRVEVGALPVIDADALQMRQLLQNLVGNAIKYRRADVPPVVRLTSARLDDRHCTITVADNGIGFQQEHADRIFGMFERLHGRSEYDGSGIGLAICRKIVERHRGTISAASTAGQGAVFTVTLPVTQHSTGFMS